MLSCKDITEKASDYLDKELPFYTRMQVKLHVMMCVNCKRYLDQLRTTISALGKMKEETPVSEQVVDNIVNNLNQLHKHSEKPEK